MLCMLRLAVVLVLHGVAVAVVVWHGIVVRIVLLGLRRRGHGIVVLGVRRHGHSIIDVMPTPYLRNMHAMQM